MKSLERQAALLGVAFAACLGRCLFTRISDREATARKRKESQAVPKGSTSAIPPGDNRCWVFMMNPETGGIDPHERPGGVWAKGGGPVKGPAPRKENRGGARSRTRGYFLAGVTSSDIMRSIFWTVSFSFSA
jgi:hypothetical protein